MLLFGPYGRRQLAPGISVHQNQNGTSFADAHQAFQRAMRQAVRDAGYRTSLFGKAHLHPHRGDLRPAARR